MLQTKWALDHKQEEKPAGLLAGEYIPEFTACPFTEECVVKKLHKCWHQGASHPYPYRCSTAILIQLRKKQEAKENVSLHRHRP